MAPTSLYSDGNVDVVKIVVGPIDNNVFVVRCKQTGKSLLIDAANEHERLLQLCKDFNVDTVIETHGHWDHIGAVTEVRNAGYEVGVAGPDASMLPSYDYVLEDDAIISVGNLKVRTIATPGHTPGSMCFFVEETPLLFTGDTLFPGGPGATHFPGGNFDDIIESIEQKLFFPFKPETIVLPGHGDSTTIGEESPHLQQWIDRHY